MDSCLWSEEAAEAFHAAAPAPPGAAQHSSSTPAGAAPGKTRVGKLKREYARKQATADRVWDDVDLRWVEGPVKNGKAGVPSNADGALDGGGGADGAARAVKGISLNRDNAVGKSADVQAAVHARVSDMENSQQKAILELRSREAKKRKDDSEEDAVRRRLKPAMRVWGEEHGKKKKQLRTLLANLHAVLWEGSGWKTINLADVLDDSKVKRAYHRASRVVHLDKTGHLDAEKRFVAKRVFDVLTQAKVEFDAGAP